MIKAVLFDMDGVIIDSFRAWLKLFNFTLESFGKRKIGKKEFTKEVWAHDFTEVTRNYFPGTKVIKISNFYFSNFIKFKKNVKAMKNAKVTLKTLKKMKIKTAIVSNTHSNISKPLLKSLKLLEYFDLIVGAELVKHGKPAPDMLIYAIKKLNVKKQESLMVGDTKWDMIAAKRAKITGIGFKTKGDKTISDLKELIDLLE